eukprot:GDKH01000114.1.p1 GENE.GDKH01000114.1~~GDKH01000114.1.p1  ORF type:complete len:108 (-),score=0.98 GDKH01000114.1:32-355(-)
MDTLLSVIIVLASVLLIVVVFVQNPKGGGLSSDFGAAQQLGGVQKTNDFIDKTTWGLAGVIAVLSILLTIRMSTGTITQDKQPVGTEESAPGGQPAASGQPTGNPAK